MSAVALKSFGFGNQLVRVADQNGAPWFVANDVCAALELPNVSQALKRLEDDEKDDITTNDVVFTDSIGRQQKMLIISESGVYSLIFTSRKPSARAFRKWVTSEVLPTLRRDGHYEMAGADAPKSQIAVPDLGTRDDRDALRVATLLVREAKDLYGQAAGRQMWVKLGFPVPDVDLSPAPPAPGEAAAPIEGDLNAWANAAGVKASKRDATSAADLWQSYVKYCSKAGVPTMPPGKFDRSIKYLWGVEEHPEMVRVILTKG